MKPPTWGVRQAGDMLEFGPVAADGTIEEVVSWRKVSELDLVRAQFIVESMNKDDGKPKIEDLIWLPRPRYPQIWGWNRRTYYPLYYQMIMNRERKRKRIFERKPRVLPRMFIGCY